MAGPPQKKRRYSASSHDDSSFGIQSLPVATLPPDFNGDPTDGEQYLAVVRREAAAGPSFFFASHNPYAQPPALPTLPSSLASSSPDHTPSSSNPNTSTPNLPDDGLCMPSAEWRLAFTQQYKNARESLSNPPISPVKLTKDDLPKISNASAWYAWIHGRPPPPNSPEEVEKQAGKKYEWRLREPTPALLLRLSTEQILGLLDAWPYWIAHRVTIPDGQAKGREKRDWDVLQPLHARWLFALLLRLDGRLVSEEISTLRTLARACVAAITLSRIRRKALCSRNKKEKPSGEEVGEKEEGHKEEENKVRRDEAGAWMIVAIVAGVWGQSDLWEDAKTDMKRVT